MATSTFTMKARWIFPVTGTPIANGVVTVRGETIAAIESGGRADLDLGQVAILPGLVNAHTHLDLTGMRGLAPPRLPLPEWLIEVIGYRRQRGKEEVQQDIRTGLVECIRYGTTLLGDISAEGASWDILAHSPIRAVVYREVLGLARERAEAGWNAFEQWCEGHKDTAYCHKGVSPHAPYSVSRWLMAQTAGKGLPLAMHVAESREELELLERRTGPFVRFLQGLGVWEPNELAGSLDEVLEKLKPARGVILAHGNYLDRKNLFSSDATVIYCPRTHAAFGHEKYPLEELRAAGVRLALGTDGLASNPDLDLLAEARYLRQQTELTGEEILRMATQAGAEALGFGEVTGSLQQGKSADLIVVPVPAAWPKDVYDLVLGTDLPVKQVMVRGKWVLG